MATRGARTAERAHAAHWRARCSRQRRPGSQSPRRGVSAGACRVGLDRRRERANRLPLGRGRSGSRKKIRSRIGPDVILAEGSPVGPLLQSTARNIPIVFTNVVDPVGSGFVASMSHPGGNATGFTQFEYRLSGKWLELLREVAPNVTRVAVIRDPRLGGGIGQFAVCSARYSASGIGLAAGGSIPNVLAVIQVIEKLPIDATSATRLSNPIVFSAAE